MKSIQKEMIGIRCAPAMKEESLRWDAQRSSEGNEHRQEGKNKEKKKKKREGISRVIFTRHRCICRWLIFSFLVSDVTGEKEQAAPCSPPAASCSAGGADGSVCARIIQPPPSSGFTNNQSEHHSQTTEPPLSLVLHCKNGLSCAVQLNLTYLMITFSLVGFTAEDGK